MRTHARQGRDGLADRGAVLVWVALMMVVLLGMAGLVIDVGALYVERRELQNGADAGALGVAEDCALGDCADEWATAGDLAAANAKDAAAAEEVCGDGPGLDGCGEPPEMPDAVMGWVLVRTAGTVELLLAPIIPGIGDSATVRAAAIAAWGVPMAGVVSPLIFSVCEFELAGGSVGSAEEPGTVPESIVTVVLHDPSGEPVCGALPAGADLPGGFGWLDVTGPCSTEMSVGDWVSANTGADVERTCDLDLWRNDTVAIALFGDERVRGTGTGGEYEVAGFVGLNVKGFRLPGERWIGDEACGATAEPGDFWVCGRFDYVTVDSGQLGGPDYGARTIVMVG